MTEIKRDPYLEKLLEIQADVGNMDMRLDALEKGYALDAEEVDRFITSIQPKGPVTYSHFLSDTDLKRLNESYIEALNKGVECDKWDYGLAAISGAIAGLIDVLFASSPHEGFIGKGTDELFDKVVKTYARKGGWSPREGNENNVASAIGYLQDEFMVGYDQATSKSTGFVVQHLYTKNHHAKSMGHYPDIFGLIASICNQFTGTSTFLGGGPGSIRVVGGTGKGGMLEGDTFTSKIFAGTLNWIGHCISDLAGSSGSRGNGEGHMGMGLPLPLTEFFQLCNFGKFPNEKGQNQTFATVMTRVYEQGYDARHGITMSVPVILNELLIRAIFTIKKHFIEGKPWDEAMPVGDNDQLQRMLFVGTGTLCAIDLGHGLITSGGNWVALFTKMNIVAWARLGMYGAKELERIANKEMINIEKMQDEISVEWTALLERSRELI